MAKEQLFKIKLGNKVHQLGRDVILTGKPWQATFVLQEVRKVVTEEDFPLLVAAYDRRRGMVDRTEILDSMGDIGTREAIEFICKAAKTTSHYLVRYYAVRNLIELHSNCWLPLLPKRWKSSSYWSSLMVYYEYVQDRLSEEELQPKVAEGIARTISTEDRKRRRGNCIDDWNWLRRKID